MAINFNCILFINAFIVFLFMSLTSLSILVEQIIIKSGKTQDGKLSATKEKASSNNEIYIAFLFHLICLKYLQ